MLEFGGVLLCQDVQEEEVVKEEGASEEAGSAEETEKLHSCTWVAHVYGFMSRLSRHPTRPPQPDTVYETMVWTDVGFMHYYSDLNSWKM